MALVAVTAIWGSTFVVVKSATAEMPVFAFLSWRFGIATVLLLALRPRSLSSLAHRDLRRGLALGIALAMGYILQTIGLQYTSATVSGFVTGMFLVFTPLMAWAVTGERVSVTAWVAVAVATAGLALMSGTGSSAGLGELLTLGGALAFAAQIVGLSQWSSRDNAYGLTVVQLATVTILCLVLTPFEPGPLVPPSAARWAAVLFLAVAATALAFVIQTWAQAQLEPTQAAVILTLEPVFAGLTGFLVGEQLTTRLLLGAALVLVAMYLVELGPRRSREAKVAHLEP
jgi:drug/metabolite transporter (DMT)-like permease